MSISTYINDNWALILLFVGMMLLIKLNVFVSSEMRFRLYIILLLAVVLSVVEFVESYLSELQSFNIWRAVLTGMKYSITPWILVITVNLVYGKRSPLSYLPAFINVIICMLSVKTQTVFYFIDNSFQRGKLNFLPFAVNGAYIVYFFVKHMYGREKKRKEEKLIIYFMVFSATLILIFPFTLGPEFNNSWFCATVAVDVFIYYVFVCQRLTQRDALTGLLNRHSFYSDLEDDEKEVKSVIAMDMNGLKKLNDTMGHSAGDAGLLAIANSMFNNLGDYEYAYRVGGDEFMILSFSESTDIKELVEKIRKDINEAGYSCSFGFSKYRKGISIDEMMHEADKKMYDEKKEYYKSNPK